MDVRQCELMRSHILESIDAFADEEGCVALKVVVTAAQERYATYEPFPKGRVRNSLYVHQGRSRGSL